MIDLTPKFCACGTRAIVRFRDIPKCGPCALKKLAERRAAKKVPA